MGQKGDLNVNLCLLEDSSLAIDLENNAVLKELSTAGTTTLDALYLDQNVHEILQTVRDLVITFVQQNFVGCRVELSIVTSLPNDFRHELSVDSEPLNVNVRNPEVLYIAQKLLEQLPQSELLVKIWQLRCVFIHQQVLEDRTGGLYEKFKGIVKDLKEVLSEQSVDIQASMSLEIVQGFILFRRINEAGEYLKHVKTLLKADMGLVSMLGFRTRFQTKPLPQMALKVTSDLELATASDTHPETRLPSLLRLEDDTRLEKIRFVEERDNKIDNLPSIIQCLIITEMKLIEIGQAKDLLLDEELKAFVTTLLYQDHGPWAVRFAALLKNINMEANHKRTVERSLKQCEDLMHLFEKTDTPLNHRISLFFASGMTPIWVTEAHLGNLMMSLGFVKTALDLFIRIQSWEDVIGCYNVLNLRHKAEAIIRQELDKCPTEKLYCLLGDATDDVACYEQAWQLSGCRSARAQRHWGNHLFARKMFQESIPHLEKSLEINSLQEVTWLRLGYAALEMENWALAAKAYNRYTQLEQNGFESWNNLAKAYIKLGDKARAHRILGEALKCNYNNWMVWENYMLVSMDTGHFEDVLNAYKRMMELKTGFQDKEVLRILVESVELDRPDAKGFKAGRLAKRAATLLAEICTKHIGDGFYWEMAAKLYSQDLLMKTQKLQKAFSAYGQGNSSWTKEPGTSLKMIGICSELAEDSMTLILADASPMAVSQLSSSRLAIQGCIRAAGSEKLPECADALSKLQGYLDQMTLKLKEVLKK